MPASILRLTTGGNASASPNTGSDVVLENILIELRVISEILLANTKGQALAESVAQLRQDVVTEIPNPVI